MGLSSGTHETGITKKVDAAITTRNLLVKRGTDADHVAVCGASDRPRGVCTDEAEAAEDIVNVIPLSAIGRTVLMVASETIEDDEDVYTDASGKVQDLPLDAGTYYKVGRALEGAAANEEFEVEPCHPVALVVPE